MGCRRLAPGGRRVVVWCVAVVALGLTLAPIVQAGAAAVPEAHDTPALAELQDQFRTVASRVAPSVVAISASIDAFDSDDAVRADSLNAEKLTSFLTRTTRTVGSGLIIESAGYIVTNEHVVADARQIWVTTDDSSVYPAIVVGSDPRADLAVLKIPASNLPTVTFAQPGSVHRGQWAIALGNPYGLAELGEMAMSVGIVSAVDRSLPRLSSRENRLYSNLIQTTAQINPGNSGGPLFDLDGRVIGINAAVVLPQKQTNGIGFAIPVTQELLTKLDDLKQGREIIYGYLGVMVSTATARQRADANIKESAGVVVDTVETNSPAEVAGLRQGDVVMSIAGVVMRDSDEFVRMIGSMPVDRATRIELRRDGRSLTIDATTRRRELPSTPVTRDSMRFRWRGLLLGAIPSNWAVGTAGRPSAGVMVIGVDSSSPAAKDGVLPGTVITAIAGKPVADVIELQRLINETPVEQCKLELSPPANIVAASRD